MLGTGQRLKVCVEILLCFEADTDFELPERCLGSQSPGQCSATQELRIDGGSVCLCEQ